MTSPSPSLLRARRAGALTTGELGRRAARSPDYAAECVALRRLARALVSSDLALLQSLADSALQLCGAGSAGISLPETEGDGTAALRWTATAGLAAAVAGHAVPCDDSPSGITLELGSAQLFAYPQRYFSCLPALAPEMVEELVVPIPGDGEPWGTIWVAAHAPGRRFDEEDGRLLDSLASFAGAVLSMSRSKDAAIAEAAQAKAAREALQLSDTRKDEFLAMLGHELRNPIAAIDSAIKAGRRLAAQQQSAAGMLDIAERQMRQLKRLTDDLLDASRIKQGKIPIVRTRAGMQDIVADALAAVAADIEWHGNVLTTDLPDAPVTVHADAARLTQVVTNLLSNAIRYTPRGGAIDLSVRVEPAEAAAAEAAAAAETEDAQAGAAGCFDMLVITVKDNGIGIEPADLPNVLDMFSQFAGDAHGGGLGVGLAIVKRMVELHHGTVAVRSEGKGLGTEVQARLPVVCAAAAGVPAARGALAPLRILLVDDNAEGLSALGTLLELDGHEVRLAVSGEDALAIAAGCAPGLAPDLALIDIGLPGMDGFALARRLRELPAFARTRLIALSGYASEADRARGAAAGFDFHLAKPLAMEALADLLGQPRP
ncbi:hybrid sensor histidine kinase/response regulator [Cupriavidus sp. WS]|uniref:hybrid sensor histidine kinase/response regulator n=1 Tax=Cupriavidus sp. WS TaxID=1312922 RepID=UPI00036128D9|nr:hybrid sensor histidine kinase/response regulator [Cupriavidus sp. WS]